jgi:hypothetical protein
MLDSDGNAVRSPITLRAILLGLFGVVLICGLTPYNDYALNNTFLIGNNLPLGVVMIVFVVSVLINGPLSRYAPRFAFTSGEMSVAFAMMLVSCALPSSGLMRYFPASLTGPVYFSRVDAQFKEIFQTLALPQWLMPSFQGNSINQWITDPVAEGFHTRWQGPGPIPYAAWIRPAVTWGIFIFAVYGTMVCLVTIVRRQWFDNERLPFPLAQIQLALVEQPPPGRFFNSIFSCRVFWLGFAAVLLLHTYNGLWNYFPRHIARIPLGYSIHDVLSEPPWSYLDSKIKDNMIFFTALGVAYFLPGSISFSLFYFYLLFNVHRVWLGVKTNDPINYGRFDEHFGGLLAYVLMIGWIGRHHFRTVIVQAFRGERHGEPRDPFLPYPLAFWGFIGCAGVMTVWLTLAGMNGFGAVTTVLLMILLLLTITRVIAETGFIHGQLQVSLVKPWGLMMAAGVTHPVPMTTYYIGRLLQSVWYDFREVVPVYASHAMKVMDGVSVPSRRSTGIKIIAVLLLSLVVGYAVSFRSMLWMEYTFDQPRNMTHEPVNYWGARDNPQQQVMQPTVTYAEGKYQSTHSVSGHITFGFVLTGVLAFLRLRYPWWPLHPVGFLMVPTFGLAHLWFSIMLGWLARALIIRFGGARMYLDAKPLFIGLIVGESIAAGGWLIVGIVLSAMGVEYRPVTIMPT